ncbi:unnamed protein product [Discula destructiva]
MYYSSTISSSLLPSLLAIFGGSALASAVCAGGQFAIGTGKANAASGLTTYNIFTADSCAVSQTVSITTSSPCDSRYFYCQFGTTIFEEYDDPTTGISYLCSAGATAGESCAGDAVTYCCAYGFVPQ